MAKCMITSTNTMVSEGNNPKFVTVTHFLFRKFAVDSIKYLSDGKQCERYQFGNGRDHWLNKTNCEILLIAIGMLALFVFMNPIIIISFLLPPVNVGI
jgi:hypothetical protein